MSSPYLPPLPHRWHTIELHGPFTENDDQGNPMSFLKILRDGQELEGGMLFFEGEDKDETISRAQWIIDQLEKSP